MRARLVGTGLPAGAISTCRSLELTEGWQLAPGEPGACADPATARELTGWAPAVVPGTVALAVGGGDLDGHAPYDARDWWYRCTLKASAFPRAKAHRLRFDGLASIAEVWMNDELILESTDMFLAHEVDVTDLVRAENELWMCFRSLDASLAERRPRPRWKTKLVEHQQLRWHRTTLLGRIPGWTPAIEPVGPWRGVSIEAVSGLDVERLAIRTSVAGTAGAVHVDGVLQSLDDGIQVRAASLHLDARTYALSVRSIDGTWRVSGAPEVSNPDLWWPRTHGKPTLHACRIEIETSTERISIDCGRVGFRDVRVDTANGRVQFVVNGVPVFCRGSCWTTNDVVSLVGDAARMRSALELLTESHGNMVRVGGTMVYETDSFYAACDELGLMVWQDFMFANMDYPADDPVFSAVARAEAEQQVRRLARHPSVVAFCGGSEVEQQAAMFGAAREVWSNDLFGRVLPSVVEAHAPGTAYWPSTPTGGYLPFQVSEGLSHYYGVGAYRRPLDDVRLAGVKFSPECLGFSNVPEASNLRTLTAGGAVPPHDPTWKRGVPRDTGPGWDFEDVRDHYLERIYGVDATTLRSEDLDRYLALSRVVTGEAMGHAFSEWRRTADPCAGGLTWFLNDLRPGAGWGLIDSDGNPKPVLYHLRRAWAPQCVRLLDRGLDGLLALVLNDGSEPLDGTLELLSIARDSSAVARTTQPVRVPRRGDLEVPVEAAFGHFMDSTYSYRFGPPRHEAIIARLIDSGGAVLAEDVYRPDRQSTPPASGLTGLVATSDDGNLLVTLSSTGILYDVRIEVRDHRPADNHFCLSPGRARTVALRRTSSDTRPFQGFVEALNLPDAVQLDAPAP